MKFKRRKSLIPKAAKRRPNNHLAEGEATGHYHEAVAEDAVVYEIPDTVALVLDAPSGTQVTHQEHNTIMVPPGVFDRTIVREFDHFAEEARQVVD